MDAVVTSAEIVGKVREVLFLDTLRAPPTAPPTDAAITTIAITPTINQNIRGRRPPIRSFS